MPKSRAEDIVVGLGLKIRHNVYCSFPKISPLHSSQKQKATSTRISSCQCHYLTGFSDFIKAANNASARFIESPALGKVERVLATCFSKINLLQSNIFRHIQTSIDMIAAVIKRGNEDAIWKCRVLVHHCRALHPFDPSITRD